MMVARFTMNFAVIAITRLALLLLFCRQRCCSASEDVTSSASNNDSWPAPTCKSYQCPRYVTVHEGDEFEIRRYNRVAWMSTSDMKNNSFTAATKAGFSKLFGYMNGTNKQQLKIAMTAPVLTDVAISCDGRHYNSYVIRLYIPSDPLENPSACAELHADLWDGRCAAVRRFGGFATDENINDEAQSLETSLLNTPWKRTGVNCGGQKGPASFSVAQYNSPHENRSRVNEIWFVLKDANQPDCSYKAK